MTIKVVKADGYIHIINAASIQLTEKERGGILIEGMNGKVTSFEASDLKHVRVFYSDGYEEILYPNENVY